MVDVGKGKDIEVVIEEAFCIVVVHDCVDAATRF